MVDSGPQSSHNTSTSISQLLIKVTQGDVESIEEFEQLQGDDARVGLEVAQEVTVTFLNSLLSFGRNGLIPSI